MTSLKEITWIYKCGVKFRQNGNTAWINQQKNQNDFKNRRKIDVRKTLLSKAKKTLVKFENTIYTGVKNCWCWTASDNQHKQEQDYDWEDVWMSLPPGKNTNVFVQLEEKPPSAARATSSGF